MRMSFQGGTIINTCRASDLAEEIAPTRDPLQSQDTYYEDCTAAKGPQPSGARTADA
jgi:hypothetical protein